MRMRLGPGEAELWDDVHPMAVVCRESIDEGPSLEKEV